MQYPLLRGSGASRLERVDQIHSSLYSLANTNIISSDLLHFLQNSKRVILRVSFFLPNRFGLLKILSAYILHRALYIHFIDQYDGSFHPSYIYISPNGKETDPINHWTRYDGHERSKIVSLLGSTIYIYIDAWLDTSHNITTS
jgi:hypothetical protein